MIFEDEKLEEFKKVYNEEFNEMPSNDEAREMLSRLMLLYELLARPLPDEARQFARSASDVRIDVTGNPGETHESPASPERSIFDEPQYRQ